MDSTYGTVRKLNPDAPQAGANSIQWKNKQSMESLGIFAAHMTMAGAGLLLVNAALNNDDKTLKRFEQGDPTLVLDAFARGGGGFILGDLIRMNSNNLVNVSQLVGSPAISALAMPSAVAGNLGKGNVGKAAKDTVQTYMPGANFWFLKPFFAAMEDHAKNAKGRMQFSNDPLK
jgi:hypothetical protein